MAGYFNLDLKTDLMPERAAHTLNRPYKGSRAFAMEAPDAAGVITVHARTEDEARDHLVNALFDLIFSHARMRIAVKNPRCAFCGGHTQSHGRNSSGKRSWKCMEADCGRYFVLDRVWKGGINHPCQSKKPAFVRLLLSGVPVRQAADQLKINIHSAGNWAEQVAANNPEAMEAILCACGKPVRHRGSCWFRMGKSARGTALNETRRKVERAA